MGVAVLTEKVRFELYNFRQLVVGVSARIYTDVWMAIEVAARYDDRKQTTAIGTGLGGLDRGAESQSV